MKPLNRADMQYYSDEAAVRFLVQSLGTTLDVQVDLEHDHTVLPSGSARRALIFSRIDEDHLFVLLLPPAAPSQSSASPFHQHQASGKGALLPWLASALLDAREHGYMKSLSILVRPQAHDA